MLPELPFVTLVFIVLGAYAARMQKRHDSYCGWWLVAAATVVWGVWVFYSIYWLGR